MTVAMIARQVKVSEIEAGFSLLCTLAVCVYQEWGRWHHVGAAIAIPVAMAFSVHGLNNATGLGRWNWVYIPTRVTVIILGVAYSYQHYYHFLPPLELGGADLRPGVAVIMELLTLSALIAHEGHTTRLAALHLETEPHLETSLDLEASLDLEESTAIEPVGVPVPASISFVPPTGAFSLPPTNGGGLHQPNNHQMNGAHAHA